MTRRSPDKSRLDCRVNTQTAGAAIAAVELTTTPVVSAVSGSPRLVLRCAVSCIRAVPIEVAQLNADGRGTCLLKDDSSSRRKTQSPLSEVYSTERENWYKQGTRNKKFESESGSWSLRATAELHIH